MRREPRHQFLRPFLNIPYSAEAFGTGQRETEYLTSSDIEGDVYLHSDRYVLQQENCKQKNDGSPLMLFFVRNEFLVVIFNFPVGHMPERVCCPHGGTFPVRRLVKLKAFFWRAVD